MKKGYTFMEMIIVVSVIAILFMLTIPNIQKVLKSVYNKGCDAQKKIVDAAIIQYKIDYDVFLTNTSQLIDEGYLRDRQEICQDGTIISIIDGQAG